MPMSPKEMLTLLKENGFETVSQNGSLVGGLKLTTLGSDPNVAILNCFFHSSLHGYTLTTSSTFPDSSV